MVQRYSIGMLEHFSAHVKTNYYYKGEIIMKINESVKGLRDLSRYVALCVDADNEARHSHIFGMGDDTVCIQCCNTDGFLGGFSVLFDYIILDENVDKAETLPFSFGTWYEPKLRDEEESKESLHWTMSLSFPKLIGNYWITVRAFGDITIENGFDEDHCNISFAYRDIRKAEVKYKTFNMETAPSNEVKQWMEEIIKVFKSAQKFMCEHYNAILEKYSDTCKVPKLSRVGEDECMIMQI